MNSRVPSRGGITRQASTTLPPPTHSSTIRRNLFPQSGSTISHGPVRRQHTNPSSSSIHTQQASSNPNQPASTTSASREIIHRDQTGSFQIDTPLPPPLPSPHDEDAEEAEARRQLIEGWRKHGGVGMAEGEIRAVLLASLEAKVESLDEDGWMFGDEVKEDE